MNREAVKQIDIGNLFVFRLRTLWERGSAVAQW